MADSEQTISLETVLQQINDSGSVLKTNPDGSILTTTENGEAVIVYCMEQPSHPQDGIILLDDQSIESQVQVIQQHEEMDRNNVTEIVVTGQDGLERIVHLQANTIELEPNTMEQIVENDIQLNTVEMDRSESEALQGDNGDGGQNPLHKFINEGALDQLSEIVIYRDSNSTPTADENFLIQPPPVSNSNRRVREYKCDSCSKVFRNVRALRQHRKAVGPCKRMYENGEKPLVCEVCGKTYSRLLRYKAHVESHKNPEHGQKIKCTECEKTFRLKWEMIQHRVKRHGKEAEEFTGLDDRKCQFCGRQFKFHKSFVKHQSNGCNKVRIQVYECRFCNKRYMSDKYLQKHLEKGCTGIGCMAEKKKSCAECHRLFKNEETLLRHVKNMHALDVDEDEGVEEMQSDEVTHSTQFGQEIQSTEESDRNQSVSSSNVRMVGVLKSAIASISDNQTTFECLDCAATFATKNKLDTHLIRQHDMKTPFLCGDCDKYFVTNDDLKVHRRVHTGDKPYPCQYCEQKFRTTSHLAKHVRTHTGERPYPCQFCPKRFLSLGSRTQHLRIHTKERPFACDLCEKTFVTSSLRLAHRRSHTGQMNYVCPLCDSSYIYRYQLKAHEEAHEMGCIPAGKTYCTVCDRWLPIEEKNDHSVEQHSVHTWFVCGVCSRRFASEENCVDHHKTHETHEKPAVVRVELEKPDPKPVCQNCDVTFFARIALSEHESNCKGRTDQSTETTAEQEETEYVVLDDDAQENEMTSMREAFKEGVQHEPGKDLTCPRCRYKFKFHNAFYYHIQANTCHSQAKSGRILCQRCREVFTNFKEFYAHREGNSCEDVNKGEEIQQNVLPEEEEMGNPCELYGLATENMTCNGCGTKFTTTNCYVKHLKEEHVCHENCDQVEKVIETVDKMKKVNAKPSLAKPSRSHFRHWQNLHCRSCAQTFITAHTFFEHFSSSQNCKDETSMYSKYPCQICAKVFARKSYLMQHAKAHSLAKHPGSKCDVCDEGLEKATFEIPHMFVEHGRMPFRCRICDKTAVTLKMLEKHVKERHQVSEEVEEKKTRAGASSRRGIRFRCGQCGETFLSAGGLVLHNQRHREDAKPSKKVKVSCKFCGLQCNGQQRLEVHLNGCKMKKKTGEKFDCDECVVEFQSKTFRDQHVETYHNAGLSGEVLEVVCPLCDRLFASDELMKMHLRFHGVVTALDLDDLLNQTTTSVPCFDGVEQAEVPVDEESSEQQKQPLENCEVREVIILPIENTEPQLEYRCADCTTGFQRRPSLLAHIRRCHRGKINLVREVRVFHCGACEARLDDRQALLRHYSEVHRCTLPSEQNTTLTFQYQPEAMAASTTASTETTVVKNIQNKGSGHSWYSCPSCDEMFESEQTLLRHEFYSHNHVTVDVQGEIAYTAHSTGYNHSCSDCSSTFSTSADLEAHICSSGTVATVDNVLSSSSEVPMVEELPRRPASKRARKRKVFDGFVTCEDA